VLNGGEHHQILSWNFKNPEMNGNLSSTFHPLQTFASTAETSDAFAYIGVDDDRSRCKLPRTTRAA
jgi:hypothetical protein